jgi:hypothetical protein
MGEDIEARFDPIVATPEGIAAMDIVRGHFKQIVRDIQTLSEPGRAQSIAFTALEEAHRVANRAIAEANRAE